MMTQSTAEPARAQMGVGWVCIRQWALLCMCHCVFCLLACLTSDSSSLRHRAASQNVTAVSREAAVWLASINYDPSLSPTLEFNLQGDSVVLVALIKEKDLCRAAWFRRRSLSDCSHAQFSSTCSYLKFLLFILFVCRFSEHCTLWPWVNLQGRLWHWVNTPECCRPTNYENICFKEVLIFTGAKPGCFLTS